MGVGPCTPVPSFFFGRFSRCQRFPSRYRRKFSGASIHDQLSAPQVRGFNLYARVSLRPAVCPIKFPEERLMLKKAMIPLTFFLLLAILLTN